MMIKDIIYLTCVVGFTMVAVIMLCAVTLIATVYYDKIGKIVDDVFYKMIDKILKMFGAEK